MNPVELKRQCDILALSQFVRNFVKAGVRDPKSFNEWKKSGDNAKNITKLFEYPADHGLPAITGLVKPFFHPTLPLVGLNYTPLAHNTLHQFPQRLDNDSALLPRHCF